MSQFILPASVLPIPANVVKDINKVLFNFVWKGNDKIQRKKIVQSREKGGLNMIDTATMFAA